MVFPLLLLAITLPIQPLIPLSGGTWQIEARAGFHAEAMGTGSIEVVLPETSIIRATVDLELQCINETPVYANVTLSFIVDGVVREEKIVELTAGRAYGVEFVFEKQSPENTSVTLSAFYDDPSCSVALDVDVYYDSKLNEDIAWNGSGNATLTLTYQPPAGNISRLWLITPHIKLSVNGTTVIEYAPEHLMPLPYHPAMRYIDAPPLGLELNELYVPGNTTLAITGVYDVVASNIEYTLEDSLLKFSIGEGEVSLAVLVKEPSVIIKEGEGKRVGYVVLPAIMRATVKQVDLLAEPFEQNISLCNTTVLIGFDGKMRYMVGNVTIIENVNIVAYNVTVCFDFGGGEQCTTHVFGASSVVFGRMEVSYNGSIVASYSLPPLNQTFCEGYGYYAATFGEIERLSKFSFSGDGALLVVDDMPRRARLSIAQIIVDPLVNGSVYVLAINAWGGVELTPVLFVRVVDENGNPVKAKVYIDGEEYEAGEPVPLFQGNYTVTVVYGSMRLSKSIELKDDTTITFVVSSPNVEAVEAEAPRYSLSGDVELRVRIRLSEPAPADYNITGRIVVDGSWERNITIPVRTNTTEASTVVKLSLGEGKHHIKIIVGDVVAEVEVTVVGGSLGIAVAAVVGVTAAGAVLFLLRRPREIAF